EVDRQGVRLAGDHRFEGTREGKLGGNQVEAPVVHDVVGIPGDTCQAAVWAPQGGGDGYLAFAVLRGKSPGAHGPTPGPRDEVSPSRDLGDKEGISPLLTPSSVDHQETEPCASRGNAARFADSCPRPAEPRSRGATEDLSV